MIANWFFCGSDAKERLMRKLANPVSMSPNGIELKGR
jgi:hypothetical protein